MYSHDTRYAKIVAFSTVPPTLHLPEIIAFSTIVIYFMLLFLSLKPSIPCGSSNSLIFYVIRPVAGENSSAYNKYKGFCMEIDLTMVLRFL